MRIFFFLRLLSISLSCTFSSTFFSIAHAQAFLKYPSSLAITLATCGTGSGDAAAAMTSVQAGLKAGLTCLMSQATISVANNGGDIGQVLKDLSSKESIQSLAVSMISAGALQEISNKLQLPTHPQGWAGHLKHNALKQVVSAPLKIWQ